ncbi:MAG: hypothetical protein NVS2B6_17200 [Thermoleophilaceae bacterium]
MRLTEFFPRDPVRDDGGTPIAHFSETKGYALTFEQGVVTITGKGIAVARLVPLGNVVQMTPAPVEKKK